jgi:predicted hotdog family 3-hydroxylacyl-ACP dehydratase
VSSGVLDRAGILALVPHQGAMCLWDEVVAWDRERISLRAANHRDPAHPLRDAAGLRGLHLCEYGAQAMAVHGGLRAQASGGRAAPGLLVVLRSVNVHRARIDDLPGALEGEAGLLVDGDNGWQYAFRILHAGVLLAEGRAAVMPAADARGGEG